MMPNLVRFRLLYFALSGAVILAGIISLLIPPGLRLGIEFTSGSALTLRFASPPPSEKLRAALKELGYEAIVQRLEEGDYFIRTRQISSEEKEELRKELEQKFGQLTILSFYNVSPIVAKETGRNTGVAIAAAAIGVLLYVTWAFRRMPGAFKAGGSAVVALAHDVLIILGTFSVLGKLLNLQIDALFITAVLAVVGYSINNTVVVFDRLRENAGKLGRADPVYILNSSLLQTLGRCLNTSWTTLIMLLALFLLGGITTKNFVLALIIGLIAGTYSSLFIAPLLWFTLLPRSKRAPKAT